MKKIVSMLLSLVMVIGVLPSVYAEGISTAGGTGSVPVKLTAEPLAFSVTVPTSLPVTVDTTGKVTVATDATIANNSAGPVKVAGVKVEAISPWSLAEYGDLSGEKVGTKKFGLSIQDTGVSTDGSCSAIFDTIPAKGEIGLKYGAYVAPQNTEISGVGIANVVFTVGWDEQEIVYQDFEVTADNRAKVGYTGAEGENLMIPSTFEDGGTNYKVTSIGEEAFYNCASLSSITIPNSVTLIGPISFEDCISLTSINIPNSVRAIDDGAFRGCSSLTSINIPEGVRHIGICAFFNCTSLKSVNIPESVRIIGAEAFYYADYSAGDVEWKPITSLTSITYKGKTYNSVDEFTATFGSIEGNEIIWAQ